MLFRVQQARKPIAVWCVSRTGNVADLNFVATYQRRSYPCGSITNAGPQLIIEAIVDRLGPNYGCDLFADGDLVLSFLEGPLGWLS